VGDETCCSEGDCGVDGEVVVGLVGWLAGVQLLRYLHYTVYYSPAVRNQIAITTKSISSIVLDYNTHNCERFNFFPLKAPRINLVSFLSDRTTHSFLYF